MAKILLTGGQGFFAARFAQRYKNEFEILPASRNELDITDAGRVLKVFTEFKPDYVIHTAAIAVTDYCNKHPEIAHKINVDGSVNIANACKRAGVKLVFISSEQVFNGNPESGPYDEEHTPVPDTVYGQNKLEAEGLLKGILDETWILRFTWLLGMPEKGMGMASNVLWEAVTSLLKGQKIYASPYEFRGMTYAAEMVENFKKVFELPYGTYHVGSVNELSRYVEVAYIQPSTSNHAELRIFDTKAGNTDENLEYIIINYITDLVRNNERITVISDLKHNFVRFNLCGYEFIAMHGHGIKSINSVLDKLSLQHRVFFDYVMLGHFHSSQVITASEGVTNNRQVMVLPSIVGSDPYSQSLMLGSKGEAKMLCFEEGKGNTITYNLILN
jgi:dTDP-4-dehydrorhamnose reductase